MFGGEGDVLINRTIDQSIWTYRLLVFGRIFKEVS
jgi:hypothetical protein